MLTAIAFWPLKRPEYLNTLAALFVIVGSAGCAPRFDSRAGEIITRSYPVNYQKLSDCAFSRLDNEWERTRKVELPAEKRVTLSFNYEGASNVWKADFTADGPNSTRVSIPFPTFVSETHPDTIFKQIDVCAGLAPPPLTPAVDSSGRLIERR